MIFSGLSALASDYPGYVLKKDMGKSQTAIDKMKDGDDKDKEQEIHDAIETIQTELSSYGFYEGDVDGKFGTSTRKAVIAFQRKNGLTADGKVGANTWAVLTGGSAKSKDDESFQSLKKGSTGDRVTSLQKQLRAKYYYGGKITGTFDSATETAVKSFQASTGLTVDGIVGETTWDELMNETASIFQSGAIPTRTLKSGLRGYDVYILQLKLIELNYLDSSFANGFFGSATVTAVKKFQKANALDQTGTVTSTSRRYLWPTATDQKEAEEDEAKSTEDDPYVRPTLSQGSSGSYVSNAQMRLKTAGYLLGKADGIFGAATKKAVIAFQKERGLTADGVIGKATWEELLLINVSDAEQEVYEYTEDDEDESEGVGAASTKLKYGDKGSKVVKLQNQLIELGYLDGEADGIFGKKTRKAVIKLQKDCDLTQDGIVGTKTYVKIYELCSGY